jgi:hypothetical protein
MPATIEAWAGMRAWHVSGPDIDEALLRRLYVGDHLLLEINGLRADPSGKDHPLAAVSPWTVEENNEERMIARHPSFSRAITLDYNKLIARSPAVFKIPFKSEPGGEARMFVIPQLVSHRQAEKPADPADTKTLAEALNDPKLKISLFKAWQKIVASLDPDGFGHGSIKRLCLRTATPPGPMEALKNGDWQTVAGWDQERLIALGSEIERLPTLKLQSAM